MSGTIRVSFSVRCDRGGYNHVWWVLLGLQDLVIVDQGGSRHVQVRDDFQPVIIFDSYWEPFGPLRKILRKSGIPIDVEIAVNLPKDAITCAGVASSGKRFFTEFYSPPLVVENGGMWEGEKRDGTRRVQIRIEDVRSITVEDVKRLLLRMRDKHG